MRVLLSGTPCQSGTLCLNGRSHLRDVQRLIFSLHIDGGILLHFLGFGIHAGCLDEVVIVVVAVAVAVAVAVIVIVIVVEEVVRCQRSIVTSSWLPRNTDYCGKCVETGRVVSANNDYKGLLIDRKL